MTLSQKISWSIILIAIVFILKKFNTSNPENQEETQASEIVIAFGSCAHEYEDQPIFDAIVQNQPDLWIWLGDIIYGDTHDMDLLAEKYDQQKQKPEYQRLISTTPVIGIWDDHDYGVNDGGKYFSKKRESQQVLLDYLDVPSESPLREQEGAYSDYDIEKGNLKIKVILLDARYFRDTLDPANDGNRRYIPNEQGDVLGEAQWSWLEETLKNSKADLNLIGSGIQLISEEHGYEKWANFPKSRQNMFDLVAGIETGPVVFMSGDRHISEVSKIEVEGLDYPLYDFTSSGLTHTWSNIGTEPNAHRIGDLIIALNYSIFRISKDEKGIIINNEIRDVNGDLLQKMEIRL